MRMGKFEPSRALRGLRNEIDGLFDRFIERPLEVLTGQPVPPLDIAESETDIIVKVDLPGVDEKEIDVSVINETLTIKGKKEERVEAGLTYHVTERPIGTFSRSVHLPVSIRVEMIRATCKRGVLEIVLPKKELAAAKKVEVKTTEVCE